MIESYSDGSGSNYHGIGAASFIIVTNKTIIHQDTIVLDKATNNVAEYTAVENAIHWAREAGYDYIRCYVDSELVARQLNGRCAVKNTALQVVHARVLNYIQQHNMGVTIDQAPRDNEWISKTDQLNRKAVKEAMIVAGHI